MYTDRLPNIISKRLNSIVDQNSLPVKEQKIMKNTLDQIAETIKKGGLPGVTVDRVFKGISLDNLKY